MNYCYSFYLTCLPLFKTYLARGTWGKEVRGLTLCLGPNFVAGNVPGLVLSAALSILYLLQALLLLTELFFYRSALSFALLVFRTFLLFGRSPLSFENDQREEKYLTQGARDEEVRGPTPPTLDQIRFACASSSEIGHKRIT